MEAEKKKVVGFQLRAVSLKSFAADLTEEQLIQAVTLQYPIIMNHPSFSTTFSFDTEGHGFHCIVSLHSLEKRLKGLEAYRNSAEERIAQLEGMVDAELTRENRKLKSKLELWENSFGQFKDHQDEVDRLKSVEELYDFDKEKSKVIKRENQQLKEERNHLKEELEQFKKILLEVESNHLVQNL